MNSSVIYVVFLLAYPRAPRACRNLSWFYEAGDLVDYARLKWVPAWLERCLARPAVVLSLTIPSWPI
jgi:hypothetical protein